jgi:hypothetical protein
MTDTGLFVGTIDYISPEQARGEHATAQSDVYALTAVLFECLTGQVPYVRSSEERVLMAHLTEDPPRPSEVRADLPPALDDVIAQGMAKDPAQRPASASELMLNVRRTFGTLAGEQSAGAPTRIAATDAALADSGGDPGATRMAGAVAMPAPATVSSPQPATRAHAESPGERRPAGWFVPGVLVAALIAAAIGALAGGGGGGTSRPFSDSASATDIELSFPSTWKRVSSPAAIPGFDSSQTIALERSGALLLAGEVNASGPSLLSGALLSQLPSGPPSPSAVRLGSVDAYRYSNLSVHGLTGALTLYAVPSSAGVVTIACVAQSTGSSAAGAECAQIAATLRLNSVTAFALTPSPQYAGALSATLASLQSSLAKASGRLRSASSASAQAAAATALAHAFHSAGASVSRLTVSPAVRAINANLASALEAAGGDYDALSSAASAEDQGAYTKATRSLGGSYAKITGALSQLRKAGYSIGG